MACVGWFCLSADSSGEVKQTLFHRVRVSAIMLLRISCCNRGAAAESACELGITDSLELAWKGDRLSQPLPSTGPDAKLGHRFLPPLPLGICRQSRGLPFSRPNRRRAPVLSSNEVGSAAPCGPPPGCPPPSPPAPLVSAAGDHASPGAGLCFCLR